jgi:hypothetical protein
MTVTQNHGKPANIAAKTITKLTDTVTTLLDRLHRSKPAGKPTYNERLRSGLMSLDLFANSTRHEEPDEWRS